MTEAFFQDLEANLEVQASNIVFFMHNAELDSLNLREVAKDIMIQQPKGLEELMSIAIFNLLMLAIGRGYRMGEVMSSALKTAADAMNFSTYCVQTSQPHFPMAKNVIITLGVMLILTPQIVHALGCGLGGPVEGKTCILLLSGFSSFR